jgi:hypothetical protein
MCYRYSNREEESEFRAQMRGIRASFSQKLSAKSFSFSYRWVSLPTETARQEEKEVNIWLYEKQKAVVIAKSHP